MQNSVDPLFANIIADAFHYLLGIKYGAKELERQFATFLGYNRTVRT
jgi:hypothetical protein